MPYGSMVPKAKMPRIFPPFDLNISAKGMLPAVPGIAGPRAAHAAMARLVSGLAPYGIFWRSIGRTIFQGDPRPAVYFAPGTGTASAGQAPGGGLLVQCHGSGVPLRTGAGGISAGLAQAPARLPSGVPRPRSGGRLPAIREETADQRAGRT